MKSRILLLLFILPASHNLLAQSTGFDETVAFIRQKVSCCATPFTPSRKLKVSAIEIDRAGNTCLYYSPSKEPNRFNIFQLYRSDSSDNGIELYQETKFIQFHISEEKTRMIAFASHETANEVYLAFLRLIQLKKQESAVMESKAGASGQPAEGRYFISRNTSLAGASEFLVNSLRSVEKKQQEKSTLSIASKGEGWLDRDSIPVGEWKFYAMDASGKEYLVKKGSYHRTNAGMFEVIYSDTAELIQKFGVSVQFLKENEALSIPFIKCKEWEYFHPDGKPWKKIRFQSAGLPIKLSVVVKMDENANVTGDTLVQEVNAIPDEWILSEAAEAKD